MSRPWPAKGDVVEVRFGYPINDWVPADVTSRFPSRSGFYVCPRLPRGGRIFLSIDDFDGSWRWPFGWVTPDLPVNLRAAVTKNAGGSSEPEGGR